MKLDILAFGAHPDDVELACSGTLFKLKQQGYKIGVVDLTQGEMGTRGTREVREEEAKNATKILQLDIRENLNLGDGWFEINQSNKLKVIEVIRRYRPTIILMNAIKDRHPDHPRAAELVKEAAFISGLDKVETFDNGVAQDRWRPEHQFHYIQYEFIEPDFIVDISEQFDVKMNSIKAYGSQFYDASSNEKSTLIAGKNFLNFIEGRAREFGAAIKVEFGEGFVSSTPLNMELSNLLQ